MKKAIALILGCFCFLPQANADWGEKYVLGKAGLMDIDLNEADPLLSIGLLFGVGLTPELAIESEVNFGLTGGEYVTETDSGEYSIWTAAVYGAYRYPLSDTFYAKLKLGGLYENVERKSDANTGETATGFGAAGGLGFGVLAGKVLTLELELTVIDEDVNFMSIGAHYRF